MNKKCAKNVFFQIRFRIALYFCIRNIKPRVLTRFKKKDYEEDFFCYRMFVRIE